MLHRDKEEFIKILERTSAQTSFTLRLLEKDYFISLILSCINDKLSGDLVFKGATCLNKIYYSYYRLSEDLDFSLRLMQNNITRSMRIKAIKPIKESIQSFVEGLDMKFDDLEGAGHNESRQYIYYVSYNSVILNKKETVKLEVGLRSNPVLPVEKHKVSHKFLHPFTGKTLFDGGSVICLALKELVAKKLRATTTRNIIAPRDFYDLSYLLKAGFDFTNKDFLKIFKQKLSEDNFPIDLKKYRHNFGRTKEEISGMKSRIADELFPVLTMSEKETFDIQSVLDKFNMIIKDIK